MNFEYDDILTFEEVKKVYYAEKNSMYVLNNNIEYELELTLPIKRIIRAAQCVICRLKPDFCGIQIRGGRALFTGIYTYYKGDIIQFTTDHIAPKSKNPGKMNNLRILCHICNTLKANKEFTDKQVLLLNQAYYSVPKDSDRRNLVRNLSQYFLQNNKQLVDNAAVVSALNFLPA